METCNEQMQKTKNTTNNRIMAKKRQIKSNASSSNIDCNKRKCDDDNNKFNTILQDFQKREDQTQRKLFNVMDAYDEHKRQLSVVKGKYTEIQENDDDVKDLSESSVSNDRGEKGKSPRSIKRRIPRNKSGNTEIPPPKSKFVNSIKMTKDELRDSTSSASRESRGSLEKLVAQQYHLPNTEGCHSKLREKIQRRKSAGSERSSRGDERRRSSSESKKRGSADENQKRKGPSKNRKRMENQKRSSADG